MSGNADNPGCRFFNLVLKILLLILDSNKPSDVLKQLNLDKEMYQGDVKPGNLKSVKTEMKPSSSMALPKPMPFKFEEESNERTEKDYNGFVERNVEEIEYNGEVPYMPIDQSQLLDDMQEEHNLRFKTGVLMEVQADEGIRVSN